MKITKSKLKQIIKEAIGDPRTEAESTDYHLMKHQQWLTHLFGEYRRLNQDVNDIRLDLNDFMSTGQKPNRFAEPDVVRGAARSSEKTNPGGRNPSLGEMKITKSQIKQIVKKALKEINYGK